MDHKADKRLRRVETGGLILVCGLGLLFFACIHQLLAPAGTGPAVSKAAIGPYTINTDKLWHQTNKLRANAKVKPLSLNPALSSSSQAKCQDMVSKNYWAQNDPSGTPPWHFITDAGIAYKQAGENLAQGFVTDGGVFKGLTDTTAHRANLLNPAFTQVGFAVCKSNDLQGHGPKLLVVQQFTN